MECEPPPSVETPSEAVPLLSAPVPSEKGPSLKVTVPAGVPPREVTVAVKVTLWPNTEGFWEDINAVAVAPEFAEFKSTVSIAKSAHELTQLVRLKTTDVMFAPV
jgi:hypothetical protein